MSNASYSSERASACVESALLTSDFSRRGTRAVGVEYTNDIISKPDADQILVTVKASKLVIVSAGAFGSPTILERSGIGAKKVLDAAGVKQLVELPGVGENYQGIASFGHMTEQFIYWGFTDHNVVFVPYLADDEAETLDAIFRGEKEELDSKLPMSISWTQMLI